MSSTMCLCRPHRASIAVIGTSGSCKSTIAALLQRLYEPTTGQIIIGNTELRTMNIRYLREQVFVMSQHLHLFDATLVRNIVYGT